MNERGTHDIGSAVDGTLDALGSGGFVSGSALNTKSPEPTNVAGRLRWRRRLKVWAGRAALVIVIFGGWQLCTAGAKPLVDPFFFGRPSGIWTQLHSYIADGTEFGSYWLQIATTIQEALYGFAIGAVVGVVFGVALGQSQFLSDVVGPFLKVINAIPRIVLGSIFIVAFGIGLTPKVLLASVLVFFIVFFNAFQGVREVDHNVIANARVLGASRWDITRHVTIPSAMTWIIASLHSAFGFAIVGALVAEVLGSNKGLGLVIKTAQGNFNPDGVYAVMATVAVIVLGAEFILTRLEHRLLSWRPQSRSDAASI